ncbi:MAG: outer membrane beta-barrel protein [Mangrovibacterium sp.]
MKKVFFMLAILMVSAGAQAQVFDFGQIRFGAGLSYDLNASRLGLGVNGVYNISPESEVGVAYTHFGTKDYLTTSMIDFDYRYVVASVSSEMSFYLLGGLMFYSYKYEYPKDSSMSDFSSSDTDAGLNFGAGANYRISDKFNINPQICYSFFDGGFLRIGVGVQYIL